MSRAEVLPLLSSYAAGDLPPEHVPAVEAAIAREPELADLVDDLREQQDRVNSALCHDEPPSFLLAALHSPELADVSPEPLEEPTATGILPFLITAGAVIAALLLALALVSHVGPGSPLP